MVTYLIYRQLNEAQIIKGAKSHSHFMETLYGITTLKSLGLENKRQEQWMPLNADAFNTSIKVTKFDMLFSAIRTFISTIEQILILWIGATMVIENVMTLGMFVAFNAYRGSFSARMGNLIDIIFSLKILSLHRERIADIALNEVEDESKYQEIRFEHNQADLEVKDLCFK